MSRMPAHRRFLV